MQFFKAQDSWRKAGNLQRRGKSSASQPCEPSDIHQNSFLEEELYIDFQVPRTHASLIVMQNMKFQQNKNSCTCQYSLLYTSVKVIEPYPITTLSTEDEPCYIRSVFLKKAFRYPESPLTGTEIKPYPMLLPIHNNQYINSVHEGFFSHHGSQLLTDLSHVIHSLIISYLRLWPSLS